MQILSASLNTNSSDPDAATALKCNSSYQIGIRFRDFAKRQSNVVTRVNCILNAPDRTYATIPYNNLAWSLSNSNALNEIPDWAEYYDIVITKNLRTRFFIQTVAFNLQYAKKDNDGNYTYQNTYDSTVYAIAVDISILGQGGNGYVFSEGDLCRLYLSTTSTVYEQSIIGQDGIDKVQR